MATSTGSASDPSPIEKFCRSEPACSRSPKAATEGKANKSSAVINRRRIRIGNDEITWAGECPWTGGYGIGTESGRVICYREVGGTLIPEFDESLADDAINGIVFWGEFIGVSSRSQVTVYQRNSDRRIERFVDGPGGAHGILVTPAGQFLAPMGIEGFFCVDVRASMGSRGWTASFDGVPFNYYALTRLGNVDGKEVIVCAGRTDGLMRIQFDTEFQGTRLSRLTAPAVDLLDVCSLQSVAWPQAVAALCLDRSVVLVKDFREEEQPQTLQLARMRGTPYSVRSALGHLFILTSQHVTMVPNLAQYYPGGIVAPALRFLERSIRADEIFTVRDRELLILTDDGLEIDDISQLAGLSAEWNNAPVHSDASDWTGDEAALRFGTTAFEWLPITA